MACRPATPAPSTKTRAGGTVPAAVIARRDKARALLLEGVAALDYVTTFIEREGIECHLRVNGRFRGASRPEHYERMARDFDDLRELAGVDAYMVPATGQSDEIGSSLYHGGGVLPNDASVHPALYHDGLLERAESAGVDVHSHTRVIGIEQSGANATVLTARGAVECEREDLVGAPPDRAQRQDRPVALVVRVLEVGDPAAAQGGDLRLHSSQIDRHPQPRRSDHPHAGEATRRPSRNGRTRALPRRARSVSVAAADAERVERRLAGVRRGAEYLDPAGLFSGGAPSAPLRPRLVRVTLR